MKKTEKHKNHRFIIADGAVSCLLAAAPAGIAIRQLRAAGLNSLPVAVALGAAVALVVAMKLLAKRRADKTVDFYDGILDTLPFMMHATDMDMNWIYMNRATENFLELKREDVVGMHCSNWNASICGTDRCSAACLRAGNPTTFFAQNGMDLRVDTNWLLDHSDNRIGYVEVVQDISEMVNTQKRQTKLVDDIGKTCLSFVMAAKDIAGGAQMLAQGSVEQAASVDELSEAIGRVAVEIDRNVDQADEAARLAQDIRKDAETGSGQMDRMIQAVDEIAMASQAIEKVIKTIDDIAFQTNMLALNAAVEAARAGQHGKGFAVVADEVRNLASKSAEAAKDTGVLIANSIEKAQLGSRISTETAASLTKIIEGIRDSGRIVDEIARSSRLQNAAINQINTGIEQVSSVVQQNSATAQQSAAASEELSSQTRAIQELLDAFSNEVNQVTGESVVETGMAMKSAS